MKTSIIHNSYRDRVILTRNDLVAFLNNEQFFLSYINLMNFRLEAESEVSAFIVDSSTLAKALGADQMSPDYSSVMESLISNSSRILYIGGRIEENVEFIKNQNKLFPDKVHRGIHGFNVELNQYLLEVSNFSPDTIIISVGYGLQEFLGRAIKNSGYIGKIICSGAFITQESMADEHTYFPYWAIRYNIRWFYRLLKEKTARDRFPKVVTNYLLLRLLANLELLKKSFGYS